MRVETTLQKMYDEYPDLFATRQQCLNHLFCTIGNGYAWKWGQIVKSDDYDKEANENDYARRRIRKARQSDENSRIKQDKDAIFSNRSTKKHWSKLNKKYSLLYLVPDDALPDWKRLVEECKKMLEDDGIDWKNVK